MAISNNNVQNVKFLRNGNLFATRAAARTELEGFTGLTYEKDGTAILARYQGDNYATDANDVKTLVGWVYANNSGNKSITIFDIDDAGTDAKNYVDNLVGSGITSANTATAQLEALSGSSNDTSATTSVAGAKKYTDDKIAETIDGLDVAAITAPAGAFIKSVSQSDGKVSATTEYMPTVSAISTEGQAITAVSQTNGTISATAGDIAAAHVTVADSGSLITATDVEGALTEIAAEIDAMDLAVVSGDGEVITAVSETDGKVSASKTAIKDVKLAGYVKNTTATGAISATDDIEDALSKLENTIGSNAITNADGSITVTPANGSTTDVKVHIKSGEKVIKLDGNGGGIYTDIKIASATPSSTTVKEEYNLLDSDGNALGASIKIYKDSHIVSITYITDSGDTHYQNLEYKYIDADGAEQVAYVDISSLVLEAEFASGVTVTDHVAHGVVDSTSEKDESNVAFLTVGADGFKVSGIKDAIDTKINKLDAVVTGGTTAGTATSDHVQVIVGEADGKLTGVTVTETNIANADDLAGLSGKTFTVATSSNDSITTAVTAAADGTKSVDIITDASKIKMSGFTAAESGFTRISESSSVTEAFKEVETVFIENEEVISSALNDLNTKIDNLESGSSADISAEIAARKAVDGQNGDTYAANSGKAYISGATSLNDADIKLNDALASLDADVIKSVKVNNVALAETSNEANVQISSVAASGTKSSPIVVNTDNSTGAVTLQILQIDCGEY